MALLLRRQWRLKCNISCARPYTNAFAICPINLCKPSLFLDLLPLPTRGCRLNSTLKVLLIVSGHLLYPHRCIRIWDKYLQPYNRHFNCAVWAIDSLLNFNICNQTFLICTINRYSQRLYFDDSLRSYFDLVTKTLQRYIIYRFCFQYTNHRFCGDLWSLDCFVDYCSPVFFLRLLFKSPISF